jgi:hypothetical protein
MREPPGLAGRQQLVDAINELLTELDAAVEWENDSLHAYFEALNALLGSIENAYTNTGNPVPDDPWAIMARALRGARSYE